MTKRHVFYFALAGCLATGLATPAVAQQNIKIGELNSYKSQPAFLDPYKKGWKWRSRRSTPRAACSARNWK